MPPLISVVSPSWNQGSYLAQCLLSCQAGKAGEVEHLVIDNCSDDSTLEVLNSFPKVRAIIEKDRGQSDALNKGIAEAKGEWVLWLNCDDYLTPGAMERFLELARNRAAADVIYGHMVLVDQDSKPIRTVYQPDWRPWMIRFGLFGIPSTGTLFRRRILTENPLDEEFHMIMDSEWCLRTCGRVKSLRLREKAVCFRITEDNKTAAHIMSGFLTPKHQAERKLLAARCNTYGNHGETDKGIIYHAGLSIIRKIARYRLYADKWISRRLAKRNR